MGAGYEVSCTRLFAGEALPESAVALAANCRDDLVPGTYMQTEREILAMPPERYQSVNTLVSNLLTYLTSDS